MKVRTRNLVILAGMVFALCTGVSADTATTPPLNLSAIEEVYSLDSGALAKLYRNKMVVLKDHSVGKPSGAYMNLFSREEVSVFITSDVMLHVFHNVEDNLLEEIERAHLYGIVESLASGLRTQCVSDYTSYSASTPRVKEAARRNVMFFTVACKLLDNGASVPAYVQTEVDNYVQKILDHNVTEFYPGDDYTQYEPRGHYEGDAQLERYFRCMKWLGRRLFRIWDYYYPDDSNIELTQAVMIAQRMDDNPSLLAQWQKLYDVTTLLVGTADSVTPVMVSQAVGNAFPSFSIQMLETTANLDLLRAELDKPEYPESEIIPVPLQYPGQIPPKYIQFLGERYVPDSYVFQQVSYPYIGDMTRMPLGLEVMVTMLDSHRADTLLAGEKALHPDLIPQYLMLKDHFSTYTVADWTRTTYNYWLYTLKPLLIEFAAPYPPFMRTTAWQDEKINTCLASWTQLRHDFILYAKQTNIPSPMCYGYGYVEPVPEFYARLEALCEKVRQDMSTAGVLSEIYDYKLMCLANELHWLEGYAAKILAGEQLTGGPGELGEQGAIHGFGVWLLDFFSDPELGEKEPTLVVDVCTNSTTHRVLHEGVGKFNPIIVIYQQPDGKTLAGLGYVMSYYEFCEEGFNRLSDSEWSARVESGNLPLRPVWTDSFLYPGRFVHARAWMLY